MAHEVIMPQLGMVQDVGVIVKWHKQIGEEVNIGDVLMDVETDKAVMEVAAEGQGHLIKIIYAEGEKVPIGDVVALIGENLEEGAVTAPKALPSKSAPVITAPATKTVAPKIISSEFDNKILASPKVKRKAHELGIDLQMMKACGFKEPFHAAALEEFIATQHRPSMSQLFAEVDADKFYSFARWAVEESSGQASIKNILCAFSAHAWRKNMGAEDIVIEYTSLATTPVRVKNCDRGGLSECLASGAQNANLILYNLLSTGILNYRADNAPSAPTLTVSDGIADSITIILRFDKRVLPLDKAITLLRCFTDQLIVPLRHLM